MHRSLANHSNAVGRPARSEVAENGPALGYAVLNERRLKQLDELMFRLARPDNGMAGNGDLTIRVQDGKLRFARPVPYPYFVNFPYPLCPGHTPAAGLKIMDEPIAKHVDEMLLYLVRWGNGDLHILILNGDYQAAVPVPDIAVEW